MLNSPTVHRIRQMRRNKRWARTVIYRHVNVITETYNKRWAITVIYRHVNVITDAYNKDWAITVIYRHSNVITETRTTKGGQ